MVRQYNVSLHHRQRGTFCTYVLATSVSDALRRAMWRYVIGADERAWQVRVIGRREIW